MTDAALAELAQAAGVAQAWKDVFGKTHDVEPPTLRAVLASLGFPAMSDGDVADSLHRARAGHATLQPLLTAEAGSRIAVPGQGGAYRLVLEDGRVFEGRAEAAGFSAEIAAILEPGYHTLEIGGARTCLAVAPRRCFTVPEATRKPKSWGLAVQLYALRRPGDSGLGDFAALAALAAPAATQGAQAIGISPVHAQFSADTDRCSPYAPASWRALNVLHASIDKPEAALAAAELVDWPAASRFRLAELRRMFAQSREDAAEIAAFEAFRREQAGRLQSHAVFEVLHAHFLGQDRALWHWRSWPAAFQDPDSLEVAAFAEENAGEVAFHAWLQFRADRGLAAAQLACRSVGMGIGLVSDLAVGTDSGGSQCWSRQSETLLGVTVGAPPDLLQRNGQNWGLTAFSPVGLAASGYTTYREMLGTALAHAGGMRIDHAMGLNRLWVIPDGATGAQGAYLSFPETDLLRLIKLESQRHRAIVLAEDLGTVPEGFQDRLREAGIDGMRVLWFERDANEHFTPPDGWTQRAAAMTSTHDLPTLAGWWSGRDIAWNTKLGHLPDPEEAARQREADRAALWQAFRQSGTAAERPAAEETGIFADAACAHVGRSACELVMLPVEDALGLVEQPNLPGTLDEHPNWRRRLPAESSVLLEGEATRRRLAALDAARSDG